MNRYDMPSAFWMINQGEVLIERMKYEYVISKNRLSCKTEEEDT